jgi:hypothetical protein
MQLRRWLAVNSGQASDWISAEMSCLKLMPQLVQVVERSRWSGAVINKNWSMEYETGVLSESRPPCATVSHPCLDPWFISFVRNTYL